MEKPDFGFIVVYGSMHCFRHGYANDGCLCHVCITGGSCMVNLGIPTLTAHMFVFYFAIMSTITPPVCTGIYAASTIADVDWVKTVPDAIKLG